MAELNTADTTTDACCAAAQHATCCAPSETFDGGSEAFGAALWALGDREQLPNTATLASLGCGNPTAVAELHEVGECEQRRAGSICETATVS